MANKSEFLSTFNGEWLSNVTFWENFVLCLFVVHCSQVHLCFTSPSYSWNFCLNYSKYSPTMECLVKNTLLCSEDDTSDFNTTVFVTTASLGMECMKMAGRNATVWAKIYAESPIFTTMQMCDEQPQCSTMWHKCLPESMDPKEFCK